MAFELKKDPKEQFCSRLDDLLYGLNNGYIRPAEVVTDEGVVRVIQALNTLNEFEDFLIEEGLLEYV